MSYFFETEFVEKRKLILNLKGIYGINTQKASVLCKKLGIADTFKVKRLSKKYMDSLANFMGKSNIIIGNSLKKQQAAIFKNQVAINARKGLRKLKGLPVRDRKSVV